MNNGTVKIRYKLAASPRESLKKHPRPGYCKYCGAPLKTDKSKSRWCGRVCFERHAMIILEIPGAE
jgi:hypothetical protein